MDELWPIAETSTRTKIPVATLRDWRARGRGPRSFRLGGKIMYKASDVMRWIDEQYAASGGDAA